MPTSRSVVLGIQKRQYINRNGQEVCNTFVFYYNPLNFHDSRMERGYITLSLDIFPDLSISDFESEFPALYDFKTSLRRDLRSGKAVPQLQSVNFIDNVTIDDSDHVLILGVKKIDYDVDGSRYRGVKLFYVDLNSYLSTDSVVGLLPIEQNIANADLKQFPRLPGFYDLDLEEVRGSRGAAIFKLHGATFKAPWGDKPLVTTAS
jgi:hypothetical protein